MEYTKSLFIFVILIFVMQGAFCDGTDDHSKIADTTSTPTVDKVDSHPSTTHKEEKRATKKDPELDRNMASKSLDHMLSQLVTKHNPGAAITQIMEKPGQGQAATELVNPKRKHNPAVSPLIPTIRPVGGSTISPPTESSSKAYKEPYLPLYACDEVDVEQVNLESLYRGCMHGCQMREPVKVTKLKLQSPKPYHAKLDVTWFSATQMYDMCRVDIIGGEHRIKTALEYPLSNDDILKIKKDIGQHMKHNQDFIHGSYPKAECSYWHETTQHSILTRIRLSHYDMYWAPEVNSYYIHIPQEQVNVLVWDSPYHGSTGTYTWDIPKMDTPCLLKTDAEITCLGSMKEGDPLQCITVGTVFEGPYVSSWDSGCQTMTTKDARGNHFLRTDELEVSYLEATRDSNPNVQTLSSAISHIEELLCITGCSELTMMSVSNNTDTVVDTPVGIWKRSTESGHQATRCSSMATGKIHLLTPVCTILGVVGVQHISSSSTTYYWDMNMLYATTYPHPCMRESLNDVTPLMIHKDNGTLQLDTFMGRIELNSRTGESNFLYYNEQLVINKKRWFPNVALEQESSSDKTEDLEIAIMQQLRNLSMEYQASCEEAQGPVVLQTVGGAVWMLEKDVFSFWGNIWGYIWGHFWFWKVILIIVIAWIVLYFTILCLGMIKTISGYKSMIRVPVDYSVKTRQAHRH